MALTEAEKKTHGIELIEFIYFSIRSAARFSCKRYRETGNINDIKRAVDMPHRIRDRINYFIETYDATEGAGAGQAVLIECVNASGMDIPVSQINSELTILENAAQVLVDHVNIDGWTWDQVATAIENYFGFAPTGQLMPIRPSYVDIWGE